MQGTWATAAGSLSFCSGGTLKIGQHHPMQSLNSRNQFAWVWVSGLFSILSRRGFDIYPKIIFLSKGPRNIHTCPCKAKPVGIYLKVFWRQGNQEVLLWSTTRVTMQVTRLPNFFLASGMWWKSVLECFFFESINN